MVKTDHHSADYLRKATALDHRLDGKNKTKCASLFSSCLYASYGLNVEF